MQPYQLTHGKNTPINNFAHDIKTFSLLIDSMKLSNTFNANKFKINLQ